jgi:hypothetical protein
MATYSLIFETLDKLRAFAECRNNSALLKEVEGAKKIALEETLTTEMSDSDANYDAVMALVYPELERGPAAYITQDVCMMPARRDE